MAEVIWTPVAAERKEVPQRRQLPQERVVAVQVHREQAQVARQEQ